MGAGDFLRRLTGILERAGVPYMLSGSMASALHGDPRATQDIDLVVEIAPPTLSALLRALPESDYYVSADAARDAVRLRGQFNVIDMETGWKADLIVRKERAFSRAEFERRHPADVLGVTVYVASPEDVILSKLEWARRGGGSERQLRDVRGVVAAQGKELNRKYIERWIGVLGVAELWESVSHT